MWDLIVSVPDHCLSFLLFVFCITTYSTGNTAVLEIRAPSDSFCYNSNEIACDHIKETYLTEVVMVFPK